MNRRFHAPPPPTVLLIEDDAQLRFATAAFFGQRGYSVLMAPTAHDAIQILLAPFSPVDVAVLDASLPDLDGMDLCARICELYPDLPVIVTTAQPNSADEARLQELGVQHCLTGPVTPFKLFACVEELFRKSAAASLSPSA